MNWPSMMIFNSFFLEEAPWFFSISNINLRQVSIEITSRQSSKNLSVSECEDPFIAGSEEQKADDIKGQNTGI